MPPQMPAEILKLRSLLASDPSQGAKADGAWDEAWRSNVTPWDSKLKDVQPSLRELIEENWGETGIRWEDLRQDEGKALVAGCGRGYDAIYFASRGIPSVGIDLSPRAVEAAQAHLATLSGAPTNVSFQAADFFSFPLSTPQPFSLAYDFTFFCAIPPDWRRKWGDRYAELIRTGGVLITLEYPLDGDREGGPPFSVSEEAYEEVLTANFEKVYDAVPTKQSEGHENREKIVVWKRK
ncbi:uncharacterized protein JCM6883_003487 [Sporobolomyces salmoneus]|uniref:uncharacterized protein n=1 Tax=Sporobolomyces salmoneus TaxID=183962 RepID=UPI00316C1B66